MNGSALDASRCSKSITSGMPRRRARYQPVSPGTPWKKLTDCPDEYPEAVTDSA
jgi:hypothetical protein